MSTAFKDQRGTLQTDVDQTGVARICFGHPSHNAFPSSQLFALSDEIRDMGNREDIKVIRLQSAGERTFCAGASFDELLSLNNEQEATLFFSGFARVLNAIRTCGKLVVVQVQGKAIGGGAGLAAACDYAFATPHAQIRLSELGLHIGPFVIEPALRRKIGLPAVTEMALNPQSYKSAEWAGEKGLFQDIYPDLNSMEQGVDAFCTRLSEYSSEALKAIKAMFWADTSHWETLLYERAGISGRLVLQAEARAHLQQFKDKSGA